jgi:DNA-binding SARP family transcriptional activator
MLDGHHVQFATRHAAQALFCLVFAPHHTMDVVELGERLWPDAPLSALSRRMATMTWQLRRALGDGAWRIQRNRSTIALALTRDDEIDALVVRETLEVAVENNRVVSSEILDLSTLPLLEPWHDEEWVRSEQQYLATLAARAKAIPQ